MVDIERCQSICKSGKRCRAPAMAGRTTCCFHAEDQKANGDRARSKGGKNSHPPRILPTPETPEVPLETLQDVSKLLATVINDVRRGQLDVKIGNAISTLAAQLMHALEAMADAEVTAKLEELRRLAASRPTILRNGSPQYLALLNNEAPRGEIKLNEPPPDD
jgi:hypothetical protein